MQDTEFYRQVLGLEPPWTVARVDLDLIKQRVDVYTVHQDAVTWACPECGRPLATYDHVPERVWRHLDTCQLKTFLHARVPRVDCPDHGVRQIRVPWAEPHSQFTALFERLAVDLLLMSTIQGARKMLRISWAQAWLLEKKAVARGLQRKSGCPVRALGIDEKSIARGHVYATIFSDLDRGTVEHVEDDRKEESLGRYLRRLTPERQQALEVIAMDMWEAYFIALRKHLPGWEAKTVIDRYHLMVRIGRALDQVRAKEHRELKQVGDRSLKRSRYLWLHSRENLRGVPAERLEALLHKPLRTARAWALKESFRELWDQPTITAAAEHFRQWYYWATHSRLWPMIQAAKCFKVYLRSILNYFTHRMTNAVAEGLNSKIQGILKSAYGYRNKENFKTAVYFHCGGLSLYPATHLKV